MASGSSDANRKNLTIFAIPKPFVGHIGVIQRNAIRSWLALEDSEVLLLGDEDGIAKTAAEFNLRHFPDLERNRFNTPTVSSAFEVAQKMARGNFMAYVNADIILTRDLLRPLKSVPFEKFLLSFERVDVDIKEELDLGRPDWEERLRYLSRTRGTPMGPTGMDCFIFPTGMYHHLPPFGIGRAGWDTWLIYWTCRQQIPVIDATPVATLIHQNHDYSHHPAGINGVHGGPEMDWNLQLAGGWDHIFTLQDAEWLYTPVGLEKSRLTAGNWIRRLEKWSILYPWSRPLVRFFLRGVMYLINHLFGKRFWRDAFTEYRILMHHLRGKIPQRQILEDLKLRRDLRLHLGSNIRNLPGWINIDAFPGGDLVLDLRRGLPFTDDSADFIFHEHFLEHLDYHLEVPDFLGECYRVLKPGGTMRVVVPDVAKFVEAYQRRDMDWFHHVEPGRNFASACEGLALNFHYEGQHHSAWDFETLALSLHQAGFSQVEQTGYRQGPLPELNLEADTPVRADHSLCVNATK